MLTNDDLRKIQGLMQSETRLVLQEELGSVKNDISGLKKDMKIVKQRLGKIEKTASIMLKTLNEDDVKLERRVTKIEDYLGLN